MNGRLRELWNEAGAAAKAGVALGALLILVLAVAAAIWVVRDDLQPLFTELDPRDASAITAELERLKVPYKIGEDGATILVDKSTVHATRLKVMGKGVDLKGTVGFEIFNNTDFGMTEFAQRINYQRALQGELARTIMAFEEVKSARVHLVMPESGLLRKSTIRPKASVTLAMRGERPLQPEQIQGIQRLVAAAVSEMDPAAVTVLDQQGVALSRRADPEVEGDLGGLGGSRLEAKREIEGYLTRKVVAVLDKAFGPGQGIVSVDVTLSHDLVKTTREDVVPAGVRDGAVARRKDTTQSAPQMLSVIGVTQTPAEAGRGPSATTSEVEYMHGRKIEQTVSSPGSIRRISVGVVLPGHIEPYQAESIKQVVAMAVGLNPARGDGIALSWASRTPPGAAAGTRKQNGAAGGVELRSESSLSKSLPREFSVAAWWLAAAVALALLAGAAFYSVGRARRKGPAQPGSRPLTPAEREEMLSRIKSWIAAGAPASEPNPGARG
jgi:flagellar M-ring protein FliF